MFCRNCGQEMSDDAIFCENCGFRVQEVDEGKEGFNVASKNKMSENVVSNNEDSESGLEGVNNEDTSKEFAKEEVELMNDIEKQKVQESTAEVEKDEKHNEEFLEKNTEAKKESEEKSEDIKELHKKEKVKSEMKQMINNLIQKVGVKKLAIIGGGCLLVIVLIFILKKGDSVGVISDEIDYSKIPIFYTVDGEDNIYYPSTKKSVKIDELNDVKFVNESVLYYLEEDGDLYRLDNGNKKKKIDNGVYHYNYKSDSKILSYVKIDKEGTFLSNGASKGKKTELSTSDDYLTNKERDFFAADSGDLYIGTKLSNMTKVEPYRYIRDLIFVKNDAVYYESDDYIYKTNKNKKTEKLFKGKSFGLEYNIYGEDAKILYQDEDDDLYLYNGEENIKVAPNVDSYESNIIDRDLESIRFFITLKDDKKILWDEETGSTVDLGDEYIRTHDWTSSLDHILFEIDDEYIMYSIIDEVWVEEKINLDSTDIVVLSDDGERVLNLDRGNNNLVSLYDLSINSKKEIKYGRDFDYTKDLRSIIAIEDDRLYFYSDGDEKIIYDDVNEAKLSRDGKNCIFQDMDDSIYISRDGDKPDIISNDVKDYYNYREELIYYIDYNDTLYNYDVKSDKARKIAENVEDVDLYMSYLLD
ncbi:MAG: zinc-ribbon domain-containing protein [Eubacteriales bacterium]